MNAKYYTYRNLNFGTNFSTKHHGIVIGYVEMATIKDGHFRVSDAGRERCIREKTRNVHAFIASDAEPIPALCRNDIPDMHRLAEVKYNPYRANTFVNTKTGEPISRSRYIYLLDGRCYVDN